MDGADMEPTRHKVCMNVRCGAISSAAWKRGWRLRSGGRADLCTDCGSAFDLSRFCEKFHAHDPGWRSCIACGKGVHCGCVVSLHLFVLLDTGGVSCRSCRETGEACNLQGIGGGFALDDDLGREQGEELDLHTKKEVDSEQRMAATSSEEGKARGVLEELSAKQEPESMDTYMEDVEKQGTQSEVANLNTSLGLGIKSDDTAGGQSGSSASAGEAKETPSKYSPIPYRPRHRQASKQQVPPRAPVAGTRPDTPETINDPRVARPPADGKGRNQLLPRYWPRVTDQEIQQFTSGDSKVVPLFEKVLSASDAGRIGRLVLPKACAEAYFPPISQAEGLPLRINDISGKEWQFQFRFWPNNNSRMYVLEGVTPCIQAMQLQAGDTVTFSRLEPEGKLIMGYRKAQDSGDGDYPGGKQADYKSKAKETQSSLSADKRRGRPLGAKSKRLRLDSEDSLELKTSWEEAQELLRPPPGVTPSFVTIDGHQFEEYEEPPVLTKKTVTRTKPSGEQDRWVQCDDCSKFRRVPLDIFIHTRWTCVDNVWDLKRATCSAAKELSNEDMEQLMESMSGKNASSPSGLDALATAAAFGDDKAASPPPPAATTKHPRHRPGCTCIVCIQPPSGKGPKHKPTCVCNVCLTVKRRFKTLMMRRKKRQSEREAETARKKKSWERDDAGTPEASPTAEAKWLKGATPPENNGRGQQQRYNTRETPKASPGLSLQPCSATETPSPAPIPFVTERGKTFPFPELLGAFSSPAPGPAPVADGNLAAKGGIDLNSQPERDEASQQNRLSMMRLLQDASLPLDMYLKQQGMANLVPGAPAFLSPAVLRGGNGGEQAHQQQQVEVKEQADHSTGPDV